MVKAELSYNPYILETEAKFNEKKPHINSQIEKYKSSRLQDWIKEVPRVFYEELNGYGFEIFFSGTQMEYIELCKIFDQSVSSEEKAIVTLVKELENRQKKLERIDNLFMWLRDTGNDFFKFDDFCDENDELINVNYPVLIINGNEEDINKIENINISYEYIDDIRNLENTNLINIPIIFFIDEEKSNNLREDISFIRNCKYVTDDQLFFIVRNDIKKKTIERFLQDLGLDNPIIIERTDDDKVYDYLNAFPITQHIYDICKVFETKINEITERLEEEKENSAIENTSKNIQIENLTVQFDKIENSIKKLSLIENFIIPIEWVNAGDSLMKNVSKYKEAHTVFVGKETAEKEAINYQLLINKAIALFDKNIDSLVSKKIEDYERNIESIYNYSGIKEPINIKISSFKRESCFSPQIKDQLLDLRVDKIIDEKSIFAKKDEPPKKTLRREYYLTNWRKLASDEVKKEINRVFSENKCAIEQYRKDLIDNYIAFLNYQKGLIENQRNQEVENLSDEEKRIEKNSNWLKELKSKVEDIERK